MTTKENMSIGDRMLAALHRKGWSLSELSRRTGVPQPTIHRIGAGVSANPRRESIEKIARALGVSAEWLWTGREGIPPKASSLDISDMSLWDESTPLMDDEIEVPFLREVELAAGSGRFAIEEDQAETLRFRKKNLRENGVQFNQAKCVTVRGNSMIPVLRDGATVGVDLGKTSLGDVVGGDLYAINHNGQLRVKQVFRLPSGLRLRSFNREEYPDEDYTFQEIQDQQIAILGHVFWWAMYAK